MLDGILKQTVNPKVSSKQTILYVGVLISLWLFLFTGEPK
jgi:hypothetical protein